MLTLIVEPETVNSTVTGKIELEELDDVALLVEWLNTLLYELDVNRLLFKEFDIVVTGQTRLARCLPRRALGLGEARSETRGEGSNLS